MKEAILLVSFGVADDTARAAGIDAIAGEMSRVFLAYEVRQAFTSNFIRARLAKRGIEKDSLPEALARLKADGFTHVYVQPTHLTPGEEYEKKICAAVREAAGDFEVLKLGDTVFTSERDYEEVADILEREYPALEGEAVVLLGHGSPHQHNPVYEHLQTVFDMRGKRIYVGVIEPTDTPDYAMVIDRLQKAGIRKITLAPLLLSGGVHVNEDMAGSVDDSWKSRMERDGITVHPVLTALGEFPDFRKIFLRKTENLLCR